MTYNQDMKSTQKVTVTMPKEVIEQVRKMAESQGRSFSNLVSHLVTEGAKNKTA